MTTKTKTKSYSNGHHPADPTAERPPPYDDDAERALLGCLMIEQELALEVSVFLDPEDFYTLSARTVYEAILELSNRKEPTDVVTLSNELRSLGKLNSIGRGDDSGYVHLLSLFNSVPTSVNGLHYARIIRDKAQRRRMIRAAGGVATMAWDESKPLEELTAEAQALVFSAEDGHDGRTLHAMNNSLPAYLDRLDERVTSPVTVAGIPTGYQDLDRILNGLKAQELTIIAGRPGMGKTALMLGILENMALKHHRRVAVFSLEMSETELINRMVARIVDVDTQALDRGDISESKHTAVQRAAGQLDGAQIFVNDKPALTPADIRAESLRLGMIGGLDAVMVDYVGLMRVPYAENRYREVSDAARAMKNLAKELVAPVILLSQLSRAVENRGEKRPMLSDLRDSGELEEAADSVLMLYRDDYYKEGDSAFPNQGEAIVAKHRHGPTGRCDLFFRKHTASYHDLVPKEVTL
jgi:replicative DNA helicase